MPSKKYSIRHFLILLAFGLVCQNFGPISSSLESLLVSTTLIVYIFICNPLKAINIQKDENLSFSIIIKSIIPYTCLIIFALFAGRISDDILQLATISAFFLCLLFFSYWRKESIATHTVSLFTTLFFTFAIFLYQYHHDYWYLIQAYSQIFSTICGFLYARTLNLGPSSFGFFIFFSFIIYHLTIFGISNNRSIVRLILAISYLFTATIIVVGINLLSLHLLKRTIFFIDRNDIHSQFLLFLISCPSIFFYKGIECQKIVFFPVRYQLKYLIPCTATFIILMGMFFAPYFNHESVEDKTVTFYSKGSLDWEQPRFGTYGQRSGGMFGLMPKHLNVMGFQSKMIDEITTPNLKDSDVLVMINLSADLNQKELLIVWDFVRSGGSLLILGDHTNLAGLMVNSNKVLDIVNIKFKFDSAMPSRYTWDFLMEERAHPIIRDFSLEAGRSWWVGASVECAPPAVPIVVGKYCYSDWGYKNNKKNAYLGNRKFDYYEPLNDQVLAAYSTYGKGKVMVCGDTSSFHNTTFMITHPFVFNTFKFLADSHQDCSVVFTRILIIVITLLFIFGSVITLIKEPNILLPIVLIFVTISGILASNYYSGYKKEDNMPYDKLNVAYIDYYHKGRFDLMSWEDDSIGGLRNNLLRNGFFPVLLREFDREKILKAKLVVIIAPTQPYTTKEVDILTDFVKSGGRVLISVGFEEMEASRPLLKRFGLNISSTPLGWCDFEYKKTKIQFHEAWPVLFENAKDTNVICSPLDFPAIVTKEYGSGSVTVIGDSYFLLNENLEGSKKFSVPNIFLLRDLIIK